MSLVVVLVGFCVTRVVGIFYLSPDTAALRESMMSSVAGNWDKKVAVRVGGITTGLVRLGARFFPLEPEPRAALAAVRGAEVGVYTLTDEMGPRDNAAILARMDRAMSRRGWVRGVGVGQQRELVAVYFPKRSISTTSVRCCVAVLQDRELMVASVRGNLEPVWELVSDHLKEIQLGETPRFLAFH
jgi:hypothetical protein